MRFDLEIPHTDNIKLVFISEDNNKIPNSIASLLYCNVDTKDLFPSDFISIEPGFKPAEYSFGGYEIVQGPVILNARSDKFVLTNKIKYNKNNVETPLFYKHAIDDLIKDEEIKIVDYYDVELSKDSYITEQYNGQTYIYINKQDRTYFVSYVTDKKIHKDFLNLTPVFEEASWGDITNSVIGEYNYAYINGTIATSYNGMLYVAYISDTKLVRTAYGNIDDAWNIGILNADFIDPNTGLRYWIPEYYNQKLVGDYRYKLVDKKKCKKIFANHIQSQYPVAKNGSNSLVVYVYNYYTNKLKYVFTNNETLVNTLHSESIYYQEISSFNYDGVIALPVNIENDDIVFCTHYTDEEYYEYTGINLNSTIFDSADYFIVYIKPNIPDTESAIGYAIIGSPIENINTLYFDTIDDFYNAVNNDQTSDCYLSYTAAIISVTNILENAGISLTDVSSLGGQIGDKSETCKIDIDVFYNDIRNSVINIPTNDSLIAELDMTRLVNEGLCNINRNTMELNGFAQNYINNVYAVIKKNLDVSTFPVININLGKSLHNYESILNRYYIGE